MSEPTTMTAAILRTEESAEFWTEERCSILELSNTEEDAAVSIARARVKPGITTRWHVVHGTAERYVMLSGTGRVEIGELPPTDVCPGDVVRIPAGVCQRITNTGTCDLIFLAICTPRFQQENYEDVDEAPRD